MINLNKLPFIVCIDFDECIAENNEKFEIQGAKKHVIGVIQKFYRQGMYIIINSCRALETEAGFAMEKFLFDNKIPYHQINRQSVFSREDWGPIESRKIFGSVYIDDKNLSWAVGGFPQWRNIDDQVQQLIDLHPNKWKIKSDYGKEYLK